MKINFRIPVFYNSNGELKKKEDKTYVYPVRLSRNLEFA